MLNFRQNLELMINLGDRSAQGRTYGNLGNTHYLLGNFSKAVEYHEEVMHFLYCISDRSEHPLCYRDSKLRVNLKIKQLRGELNAIWEMRTFFLVNLIKPLIITSMYFDLIGLIVYKFMFSFLRQTLILAEELKDQVIEAQACYSLGNTYTLLRDFNLAVEYYLRHLEIAQKLNDRIGEGRAYWSLGNAMQAVGEHHKAIGYVQKHLDISKEIGDITGQENAQISISELRQILNQESTVNDRVKNIMRPKRMSMNKMELVSITPELKKSATEGSKMKDKARAASVECISKSHEDFLELVSKFQSKRMDDQRCSIDVSANKENNKLLTQKNLSLDQSSQKAKCSKAGGEEDLFDLIAGMQDDGRRMNDQRATLPQPMQANNHNGFPFKENKENVTRNTTKNRATRQYSLNSFNSPPPDDDFFDMLMKSQVCFTN